MKYPQIKWVMVAAGVALSLPGCIALLATGAVGTAVVAHDQRTAGSQLDDESIELKVRSTLVSDHDLHSQVHVNVTSYNGIVLLSGEAPEEELRRQVVSDVRNIDKVRRVQNEIVIAEPSSLLDRSNDTLLTGKVKTRLIATKGLDSTRIKVVSEAGVVYLMGLVSQDEADTATWVTRQTDGVQRVVKLFEETS